VAIGSSKSNFLGANEDQELVGLFGLSYPNIGSYDVPVENTYVVASKDKKISSTTTSSNFIFEGAGIRIWMGSIHGSMA
jgi:hypothetical protein